MRASHVSTSAQALDENGQLSWEEFQKEALLLPELFALADEYGRAPTYVKD